MFSCLLTKHISDVGEKDTDDRRRRLIKQEMAMVLATILGIVEWEGAKRIEMNGLKEEVVRFPEDVDRPNKSGQSQII